MRRTSIPALITVTLLVAGCGAAAEPPDPGIPGTGVDVLFVIDNSGDTAVDPAQLTTAFEADFLAEIDRLHGSRPDLRIGVITTDLGAGSYELASCYGRGDDGTLRTCPTLDDPWIADPADTEAFSCLADVGASGCGFEQPLGALAAALDQPANAGFLVEDHALAVIFLAGEDDCSADGTALYDPQDAELGPLHSFRCFEHGVVCDPDAPRTVGAKDGCRPRSSPLMLDPAVVAESVRAAKGGRKVGVAVIAGADEVRIERDLENGDEPGWRVASDCMAPTGAMTAPAVRLDAFAAAFVDRSRGMICDPLATPMRDAAAMVVSLLERE